MPTLKDWYEDENNRVALSELLDSRVLRKALDLIESFNTPVFRPGVSPKDLALIHSFQAGVHHVARTLHVLAAPMPQGNGDDLPEWEGTHVFDDLDSTDQP